MADVKNFGDFISHQYGILRKIFWRLSVSDLEQCEAVCQAWKQAVNVIIKQRRSIQCIWEMIDQAAVPFIESDASLVLTFGSTKPKGDYNWCYKAKHAKLFVSSMGTLVSISEKPKLLYKPIEGDFRETADQVLASVRFPPWDGANVYCLCFNAKTDSSRNRTNVINMMNDNVPVDAEIKAVVMFVSTVLNRDHYAFVVEHLRNRQENFAFAGCYNTEPDQSVSLYIFWGPNVQAKSCVLTETICDSTKILNRLQTFSESFSPTDNGVMLAFSCVERETVNSRIGQNHRDKLHHIEMVALDKLFPKCDRLGCLGAGEIGMDCPPVQSIKRRRMDYDHSFSTVLLYIWYE